MCVHFGDVCMCVSCLGCLKPDCDSNAANAASFSLIPANINIFPANAHTHRHTCKASQRAGPYFEAELSASAYPAPVSTLPACAVTHTYSLTCQQLTHKHTHTAELHSPHQAPLALSAHLPFDSPSSPPALLCCSPLFIPRCPLLLADFPFILRGSFAAAVAATAACCLLPAAACASLC